MQPRQDAHGAGRSEPRQVQGGQLAGRRRPPEGGVRAFEEIGVDLLFNSLGMPFFAPLCFLESSFKIF